MGGALKSLGLICLSVILSFVISFCLVKAMPGSFGHDEVKLPQLFIDSYRIEFFPTVKNYLKGNWGSSWNQPDQTVVQMIVQSMNFTIVFQLLAFFFIAVGSFLLSYLSLRSKGINKFIGIVSEVGTSLPLLFLTPLFIYIFIFKLKWAPLRFDESWSSYWLPILCLSLRPLCFSTQILTLSWGQTQFQDYFRVARAKGLSIPQALWKHGLKNSILGYLTQMAQVMGQLLTGSVLIETLFSFPGLGTLFVESLKTRDLPVLLGTIFVFCLIYIIVQMSLERLHFLLEPRAQKRGS